MTMDWWQIAIAVAGLAVIVWWNRPGRPPRPPRAPGEWKRLCFCGECGKNCREAYFGGSYHANEHWPVCPYCGAYKALEPKTVRWNYQLDDWEPKSSTPNP